jgi:hypothetical protein
VIAQEKEFDNAYKKKLYIANLLEENGIVADHRC